MRLLPLYRLKALLMQRRDARSSSPLEFVAKLAALVPLKHFVAKLNIVGPNFL